MQAAHHNQYDTCLTLVQYNCLEAWLDLAWDCYNREYGALTFVLDHGAGQTQSLRASEISLPSPASFATKPLTNFSSVWNLLLVNLN